MKKFSTDDLNEKLNSFISFINGFEVIKTKYKNGMVTFEELIDYNIKLFNRRCSFINLFYRYEKKFSKDLNFNRYDLYSLLNY